VILLREVRAPPLPRCGTWCGMLRMKTRTRRAIRHSGANGWSRV